MISFYLRLFEANADQILQPATCLDPNARAQLNALRRLGAFVTVPHEGTVRCPQCLAGDMIVQAQGSDGHGVCEECGVVQFRAEWLEFVQLQPAWIRTVVRQQLPGLSQEDERELVPKLLWQLGMLDLAPRYVAVLLARLPRNDDAEVSVIRAVASTYGTRPHIVLCSRSSVMKAVEVVGVRAVVALEDVVHVFGGRVCLDAAYIRACLGAFSEAPPRPVEVSCDGEWLRVGDRALRLRGKQRHFVRLLVQARDEGVHRLKRDSLMRRAGYDAGITELRQISSRKEFLEFFDYGGGDVWIRVDEEDST